MKRPTEVVGLEAKKAALKANAAKEAFLQKQEQRKKEEVEKANKVRLAQLKVLRENESLRPIANDSDALLQEYSSTGPAVPNDQAFIEDKILRRKQRRRLHSFNAKAQIAAMIANQNTKSMPQLLQLKHTGQLLHFKPNLKHHYLSKFQNDMVESRQ